MTCLKWTPQPYLSRWVTLKTRCRRWTFLRFWFLLWFRPVAQVDIHSHTLAFGRLNHFFTTPTTMNNNEHTYFLIFSILHEHHEPFAFFVFFALKHFQLLTCRCIRWAAPYVPIPFYHVSVHNMTFLDRLRWLSWHSRNVTQWWMELLLWLQNDESCVPLVHIDKSCACTSWNSNPCRKNLNEFEM